MLPSPVLFLSPNCFYLDTMEEERKFFADSMKLAQDISNNQTFATVKPLLNFFAAFSPSKEVSCIMSDIVKYS